MKVVLSTIGSAGDAFPFIGLGAALVQRGHEVVLLVNEHFREQAERVGIRVRPTGTAAQYVEAINNPAIFHPTDGVKVVAGYVGQQLATIYQLLDAEYEPGRTVFVSHWIDFASRTLYDRRGAPVVTALLQPPLLRSVFDTPTIRAGQDFSRLPHWAKRVLFWGADRFVVDPLFARPINALRATLALGPIQRPLNRWMFSPQLSLGWWPEFFAPPQPDWPPNVRVVGFPLFDATEPVPSDVDSFLQAGDKPIVFTFGTAMGDASTFFTAAVDACQRLGKRGLLLSQFSSPPASVRDGIHFARFAPLSRILEGCAALVHHGGIGTTAAGLAAGVPHLITPLSHDQPDQAARIKRLGVGDWLRPSKVTAATLSAKLATLLDNPRVGARADELARQTRTSDGIARSVELIEALDFSDGRDAHAAAARRAARDR